MDLTGDGAFQLGSRAMLISEITDGLSNTFLVGEKHVHMDRFGVGWNDSSQYNGDYVVSSTRGAGPDLPLATSPRDEGWRFGSYHLGLCQFVMCDGSVRIVSINVNPVTLGLLSTINDGFPIPDF
jgi:hypothetical protein